MQQPIQFRLRSLLAAVAVLCVALGLTMGGLRWQRHNSREHYGQVAISKLGGTWSGQSAWRFQETGQPPGWLFCTFFNYVADLDLSRDAWPRVDRRKAGREPPPVADDDLLLLHHFSRLRSVDLQGSAVTDRGLVHLKRLRLLQELDLRDTAVSEAGVQELRSALPGCKVRL